VRKETTPQNSGLKPAKALMVIVWLHDFYQATGGFCHARGELVGRRATAYLGLSENA
jgi:hypothetical protein